MELGMLKSLLEEDLGLPQVNAIISNMGFSRKSRDSDLISSKITDAQSHIMDME